jgi:hypothetical protein
MKNPNEITQTIMSALKYAIRQLELDGVGTKTLEELVKYRTLLIKMEQEHLDVQLRSRAE